MTGKTELRPVGSLVAGLAERFVTDQPAPAEPVGDVVRLHRDLVPSTQCPGGYREIDRDEHLAVLACDVCRHTTTIKPEVVDRDLRVAGILRRSCLPARFMDVRMKASSGTEKATEHFGALLESWGDGEVRPPFLFGAYGRGKTHLLTRFAIALAESHEVRIRYCTMSDLLAEAQAAFDLVKRDPRAETSQQVLDRAATVELLVLDDLKALRTDWQRDVLEQLVDRRYRGRVADRAFIDAAPVSLPIMGATNVPHAQWPEAFGERVASRLAELTHPVSVTGPDHRQVIA